MPKRVKIDRELVLKTYTKLKSGRATARELGIHQNTVYQILKELKGECLVCGKEVSAGKKYCPKCLEHIRERQQKKREEKIRAGICVMCNKPKASNSRRFCQEHRWKATEYSRSVSKRRSNGGQPSPQDRNRRIKQKYGQAGLDVWANSKEACSICSRTHNEIAVHIHHLDGDDSNNTYDNLICLCFFCHTALHKIVDHKTPKSLLSWIFKKYPDVKP